MAARGAVGGMLASGAGRRGAATASGACVMVGDTPGGGGALDSICCLLVGFSREKTFQR